MSKRSGCRRHSGRARTAAIEIIRIENGHRKSIDATPCVLKAAKSGHLRPRRCEDVFLSPSGDLGGANCVLDMLRVSRRAP